MTGSVNWNKPLGQYSSMKSSFSLSGIAVSQGIAIGRAYVITNTAMETLHYLVPEEEIEAEVGRLEAALTSVREELAIIRTALPEDAPAELGALIEVHAMILTDEMFSKEPFNIIRTRRYNAEWALMTQIEEMSAKFDSITDPYLRERKADLEQVAERIIKALTGVKEEKPVPTGDSDQVDLIVVAYNVSPADMLQFRENFFKGFVSGTGGQNSHAAIIARGTDVPAVFGLSNTLPLIRQNDWLVVDADAGIVIVNPTPLILEQYRIKQSVQQKARRRLSRLRKMAATTLDGTTIELLANIEFPEDCHTVIDNNADGVGLFRSEFLFMERSGGINRFPDEEEQFDAYRQAVVLLKGRPVTIRTLDIGADKVLPSSEKAKALNPALGRRAIRYCLTEPDVFLTQLRAILRASAFGPVKLLLPMVAHGSEVDQALGFIEEAKTQLRSQGLPFDESVQVGAMIEVPAAVLALPMFTSRLDFLSIGTNDLIQYALAVDRVDPEVAHLYNPLHPAILAMLRMTVDHAGKAGIPVSICGEMASDHQLTRLLLGLGLRQFSMHPGQLLKVKQEVLLSNLDILTPKVDRILTLSEEKEIAMAVQDLHQEEMSI